MKLACDTKGAEVFYSLDGSEPDKNAILYENPFVVNKTTLVKMKAYRGEQESLPAKAIINKAGEIEIVDLKDVKPGFLINTPMVYIVW